MIEQIIKEELVEIYFQPIVSIKTKKVYAFEALTRCSYRGENINPELLFNQASKQGLVFQLDFLTRKKAIEKFQKYYLEDNDLMLFLNFESSSINTFDSQKNSYGFAQIIEEQNIPAKNFMLEIKEDEITNIKALKSFCKVYKELGFSIALDDFGTGNSTFARIDLIKPNLIKIDKSLFIDIKNNQINKEIIKSISRMCKNIGTQVLAEGVEDRDSIYAAMKSGINLFQGYYFSKPAFCITDFEMVNILFKIIHMGNVFKESILKGIKRKREAIENYNIISSKIINRIEYIPNCTSIIKEEFHNYDEIEAIYLIDEESSKQIHNTVMNENLNSRFKPTKCGDEHYLKEYYYITQESKKGISLSQKYISFASGNICKTFAKKFENNNKSYILCMDLVVKG